MDPATAHEQRRWMMLPDRTLPPVTDAPGLDTDGRWDSAWTLAATVPWFKELTERTGRAESLAPRLCDALATATLDHARQLGEWEVRRLDELERVRLAKIEEERHALDAAEDRRRRAEAKRKIEAQRERLAKEELARKAEEAREEEFRRAQVKREAEREMAEQVRLHNLERERVKREAAEEARLAEKQLARRRRDAGQRMIAEDIAQAAHYRMYRGPRKTAVRRTVVWHLVLGAVYIGFGLWFRGGPLMWWLLPANFAFVAVATGVAYQRTVRAYRDWFDYDRLAGRWRWWEEGYAQRIVRFHWATSWGALLSALNAGFWVWFAGPGPVWWLLPVNLVVGFAATGILIEGKRSEWWWAIRHFSGLIVDFSRLIVDNTRDALLDTVKWGKRL
jgi:hypothetical protein